MSQDFRFGPPGTAEYTPNRLRWSRFFGLSYPERLQPAREGAASALSWYVRTWKRLIFKRFLRYLSVPSPHPVPFLAAYPAGIGTAAIRRTIAPNSRRVRRLSATRSQQ